jgi:outer membrane protein assembly factor BamB
MLLGYDMRHSGRSQYQGSQTGAFIWSYSTGDGVRSSPAMSSEGLIYVGSNDNNIYAIISSGALSWSYLSGTAGADDLLSSPAIGFENKVYAQARTKIL